MIVNGVLQKLESAEALLKIARDTHNITAWESVAFKNEMRRAQVEDDCLLGCCAVQSGRHHRRLVTLMVKAVCTSVTSVNFYKTPRRNTPGDSHLYNCRRQNLKSHHDSFYSFKTDECEAKDFSVHKNHAMKEYVGHGGKSDFGY
jgi:hypothetical protein